MTEKISALMDGELEGRAADEALELLRGDREAADTWRLYHLMSDAMRGQRQLLSPGFAERCAARLATEPAVLAPGALPGRTLLQRYALAAAASLAAIVLVGWLALAPRPQPQSQPPVAQARPPAITVSLPDAANDYLLAHQGFSPRMSLQGMAPYVRTVAERPDESPK
ncbi:MAG TPA: sigma-E factor negative regulatory protein [Burkholderiales bacterium]|nr:sigma-E factor negative regulatory protein [Burkholderiales bacterium]